MAILYKDADLEVSGDPAKKVVTLNEDSAAVLGKRVHDFVSAVRVFRFAVEALQAGQVFDSARLKSVTRAADTLERELPLIEIVLSPTRR